MVIFHSYVKLPQGISPHRNFHVEKRWSGPRFIFQMKPWDSYYPYWQDFFDDYDMINDIDLKMLLFGIFELGFWCPISIISSFFMYLGIRTSPRCLWDCHWTNDPGPGGTAGPRRASFERVEKLGRWRQGDELVLLGGWLEHEMRRNDEPTRYGLLMLIGYISIDTIVDGILIYDSTCLHHFYITGWWWLEPWNLMTFHILGIVTPTDELIFFRGVGIPPTRYFIGV